MCKSKQTFPFRFFPFFFCTNSSIFNIAVILIPLFPLRSYIFIGNGNDYFSHL